MLSKLIYEYTIYKPIIELKRGVGLQYIVYGAVCCGTEHGIQICGRVHTLELLLLKHTYTFVTPERIYLYVLPASAA